MNINYNEWLIKNENSTWVNETVDLILNKMDWVSEKSCDKIPYTTIDGKHDDKSDSGQKYDIDNGINWWCNGFWGGIMWLMYHATSDRRYANIAVLAEEKLDQCFQDFNGLHHDVGFMWLPTAVANYRITGSAKARTRGMHAATILAGRFNPVGKFIRAWNDLSDKETDTHGWAIIDCMFNIPLLYWASEDSGDPRFRQIAMMHADKVMEYFVRPDGSVRHIVEFNTDTGEMVRDYGGQGYAQGSSWTRGQTWGLYGFVMSFIHTGNQEYLDTAKRIAHYFIANIPEDGLIPVDFRQPQSPYYYDDTAAAIAACGLLELAKQVGEFERDMYIQPAIKMLKALTEKHCCWGKESDAILQKCTAAYHDEQHEFTIIYGDYYFIEAMFKLKGNDIFLW